MAGASSASTRQSISRPPLAATGGVLSAAQDSQSYEASKEEIESQRLDREEALRVS
jgi:hypothetical protein